MIKLERVRTKAAIVSPFRGKTPINRLVKMMKEVRGQIKSGEEIKPTVTSKWTKTKTQLLEETSLKCAYCETSLEAVSFGDVEHYRPKSIYWWLAYVYDNYLASCSICNQRYKSNKFEAIGTRMTAPAVEGDSTDGQLKTMARKKIPDPLDTVAVKAFTQAHKEEIPLIPNPYFDDPEKIFGWKITEGIGEIDVVPLPGVENADIIVDACELIYGLNRPQLRRRRYRTYEIYKQFSDLLSISPTSSPIHETATKFVKSMSNADSEYAAMIRYIERSA